MPYNPQQSRHILFSQHSLYIRVAWLQQLLTPKYDVMSQQPTNATFFKQVCSKIWICGDEKWKTLETFCIIANLITLRLYRSLAYIYITQILCFIIKFAKEMCAMCALLVGCRHHFDCIGKRKSSHTHWSFMLTSFYSPFTTPQLYVLMEEF